MATALAGKLGVLLLVTLLTAGSSATEEERTNIEEALSFPAELGLDQLPSRQLATNNYAAVRTRHRHNVSK